MWGSAVWGGATVQVPMRQASGAGENAGYSILRVWTSWPSTYRHASLCAQRFRGASCVIATKYHLCSVKGGGDRMRDRRRRGEGERTGHMRQKGQPTMRAARTAASGRRSWKTRRRFWCARARWPCGGRGSTQTAPRHRRRRPSGMKRCAACSAPIPGTQAGRTLCPICAIQGDSARFRTVVQAVQAVQGQLSGSYRVTPHPHPSSPRPFFLSLSPLLLPDPSSSPYSLKLPHTPSARSQV